MAHHLLHHLSLLLALCLCCLVQLQEVHSVRGATVSAAPPLATLPSGAVLEGATDEKNFLSYWEGVRYAKPPIGQYRFAPPQLIDLVTQGTPPAAAKKSSGGHAAYGNAAPMITPFHQVKNAARAVKRGFQASCHVVRRASVAAQARGKHLVARVFRRDVGPTVITTFTGPMCLQGGDVEEQSEDCLYINIYKPSNSSSSDSLPVLLYIHGGGFQDGTGSLFDPTQIIKSGLRYGQPVIVATMNYRLNIFGFSASSDLAELAGLNPSGCVQSTEGCDTQDVTSEQAGLNLGYQDMKMAVNWTRTNIAAFGGNPQQVILWGHSAGSFGVSAQLLGHQGQTLGSNETQGANPPRPLFKGAIMMSGPPSGPAIPEPVHQDAIWNRTLMDAGCNGTLYSTAQARLNCLRGVHWDVLRDSGIKSNAAYGNGTYILGNYPFVPTFDGGASRGGFLAGPPSETLNAGQFASVPIMIGDVEDEGTLFAPKNLENTDDFTKWIVATYFANGTMVEQVDAMTAIDSAYPDIPADGSPYTPRSGGNLTRYYGATNQYKRGASVWGDLRFQSNRRYLLQQGIATNVTPAAWSWQYSLPAYGIAVALGVEHAADLHAIFGRGPHGEKGYTSPFQSLMSRQWISFATHLDPSAAPGLPYWPKYDLGVPSMMSYQADEKTGIIVDDYRAIAMDALNSDVVRKVTNR